MRIASLDVLRGVALLGMFIVHFHLRSSESGGFDDVIRTLIWRLVESKSHATFALLFGAGFAIQLRRAGERGAPFTAAYLRRLAVLACFGFAAHALFGYNVLLGYAAWGLALLVMRAWSTPALVAVAVGSALSVSLYYRLIAGADTATADEVIAAVNAAGAQHSYVVLLGARLRHMAWFYTQPFFFLPGATVTLFITGVLFVRYGVFERARDHSRILTALGVFGFAAWLSGNWLLPAIGASTFGLLRDQWLTFTYVAAALLLLDRAPRLLQALTPVANAGRMALTNYLLQIALLDVLFSGYAIGLGDVRPAVGLAAALACFAAAVAFSSAWLARFPYGPAEWLWRTLTYGRAQPKPSPLPLAPT